MSSEYAFKSRVLEWAKQRGAVIWTLTPPPVGIPDSLWTLRGNSGLCEFKERSSLRPEQRVRLYEWALAGGRAHVANQLGRRLYAVYSGLVLLNATPEPLYYGEDFELACASIFEM